VATVFADDNPKMKSIMTYPGFQTLPRAIKQMLVTSESGFFNEAKPSPAAAITCKQPNSWHAPQLRQTASTDSKLTTGWSSWNN